MAATLSAPGRGDIGDIGRARLDGSTAIDGGSRQRRDVDREWTGADEEARLAMVASGRIRNGTEPYEFEIRGQIRNFINNFQSEDERWKTLNTLRDPSLSLNGERGLYRRSLEAICEGKWKALANLADNELLSVGDSRSGFATFMINLGDFKKEHEPLLTWVLEYPADLILYFDDEIREILKDILHKLELTEPPFTGIRTSFFNHPHTCALRDLDQTQLERLVGVRGTCIRVSSAIPEMQVAVFQCTAKTSRNFEFVQCGGEVSEIVVNGHVKEPIFCNRCQGRRTFILVHEKCVFTTKQMMKVQENPETIPEGETPQTLFVYLYDEMVDAARPGDHVQVTGIFKAVPVRRSARTRSIRSVFRTCIDVVHVGRDERMTLESGANTVGAPQRTFHPTFIARARALAEQPNCYQLLTDAFAPNIWEHTDIKRGLLCQLFGGVTRVTSSSGNSSVIGKRLKSRGEIHVLLCGDPSTAKSQFLQYVHKIAPRGVYAVGRGTSAAGLTASVTRDPETKDFVLESGAVVLSDKGVCCIDEFDKMDENTRAILHEVMEQQTVSLAKAGIVCTLNARTAIVASANPVKSRYDTKQSVIENINLPATLLSRFDLIYLILDAQNEVLDRKLAHHLCDIYTFNPKSQQQYGGADAKLDQSFLTEYVSYARRFCVPKLSEAAKEELINSYVAFRGTDTSKGTIRATPRQLDSLVRLSHALAKMELKDTVKPEHVKEAARLTRAATYQALTDPFTGRIDFDQLHSGASEAARQRQSLLGEIVLDLLRAGGSGMNREAMAQPVDEALAAQGKPLLARRELEQALEHFEAIGVVSKIHGSKYMAVAQY